METYKALYRFKPKPEDNILFGTMSMSYKGSPPVAYTLGKYLRAAAQLWIAAYHDTLIERARYWLEQQELDHHLLNLYVTPDWDDGSVSITYTFSSATTALLFKLGMDNAY